MNTTRPQPRSGPPSKRTFSLVFTMVLAGVFLIVTGLIGYQPPAHLSLDLATWRRGTWADHVVVSQVILGAVALLVAGVVTVRVNRQLLSRDESALR